MPDLEQHIFTQVFADQLHPNRHGIGKAAWEA
jgi:hypothetical protein